MRLDRAACLIERDSVAVSGNVTESPFRVALLGCVAQVRGSADTPQFRAVFRSGGANAFQATLKVESVHLPLLDGDEVILHADRKEATLSVDQKSGRPNTNLLIEGMDTSAVRLDDTRIELSRGRDLLDLTFQFKGFELKKDQKGYFYLRRIRNGKFCEPATISLLLPPQHITESVTPFDGGTCPVPVEEKTKVAESSRIVFKLPQERARNAIWREVPLTIEALTDWSALKGSLSVAKRATAGDDLASQLEKMELDSIVPSADLGTVLDQIGKALYPPRDDETSLQLADLFLSPGPDTEFEFPDSAQSGLAQLFSIRIGRESDPRLRAIWSKLLTPGAIPAETPDEGIKRHWGIVAQTSVGGLPALRRGIPTDQSTDIDDEFAKVPRGSIVRPAVVYPYLLEVDRLLESHKPNPSTPAPPESGIALTTTFDYADIELTAFGATARMEWKGSPPIYEPTSALQFKPPRLGGTASVAGTSLERLFFSEFLGQDETIIAADKGFLLPIGFRATLLTTQKRGYLPDPNRPGYLVAANVLTRRIITRRPVKAFPALNQPDAGRDWPASSATLLTDATPILIAPEDFSDDLLKLTKKYKLAASTIFWPRMKINAKEVRDVEWKVQIEDDSTPMTAKMIFLDNSVVGIDDIVRATAEIYNRDALTVSVAKPDWPIANTARLYGARRRYADPSPDADTSFDTDRWLLTARGRSLGGEQSFIMDARMNGADQPPFYPSVRRTRISVQSVDRLSGAPQGLIECMPDSVFVQDGFTGLKQDPEIFLDVISPKIAFSLVGAGEMTVGVAQPKSFVAALSRRSGVVGGKESGSPAGMSRSIDSGSTELAFDFGNARANKFDANEAFNGSFSILGINLIGLILSGAEDTLENAPKLVERFFYGVDQTTSSALDAVKAVAKVAADAADAAFKDKGGLDQAITDLDGSLAKWDLTFEALYPDFYKAYQEAKRTVPPSLRAVATASGLEALANEASKALVAIKPFASSVETLIENPIPEAFEGVIDTFKSMWAMLQGGLRTGLVTFLDSVAQKVLTDRIVPALALATSDELLLWFGISISPNELTSLLFDPSARAELAKAFAYEQIAVPLIEIASVLSDLLQAFRGRVMLARLSLEQRFVALVSEAELSIHDRLDPLSTGGIADPTQQRALGKELLSVVEATLASVPPPSSTNPSVVKAYLTSLRKGFAATVRAAVKAKLSSHPAWFVAIAPDTDAAVLSSFVAAAEAKVVGAAAQAVADACDAAQVLVDQYAVDANRQVQLLVQTMVNTLAGVVDLASSIGVSRAAVVLSNWCQDANGAIAVALAFGDDLLGDSLTITTSISELINAVTSLPTPPSPPASAAAVKAFTDARKELLSAASDLVTAVADLESARSTLRGLGSMDACAASASLVRSVDLAIRSRVAALPALLAIARAYEKMTAAPLTMSGAHRLTVNGVGALIGKLIGDLTTVAKVGVTGDWTKVSTAAADLQRDLRQFADYTDTLGRQLKKVEDEAGDLRSRLANADPAALVAIASQIATDYVVKDGRLAAVMLQTVMFTDATLTKLDSAVLPIIKAAAGALGVFEQAVADPAGKIYDLVISNKILAYLISVAAPTNLKDSIDDLGREAGILGSVDNASTSVAAIATIDPVLKSWRAGKVPLVVLFDQLVHIVDVFLQGNFAQLVGGNVRKLANDLKVRLEEAIKQFVPTRIQTGYDWTTQLGTGPFFAIDPGTSEDVDNKHLTLSSRVTYDFISRTSSAEMHGRLHSFAIILPQMATIHFFPATFRGGSAQKTSFDVKVRDVQIGPYLKFLDELSAWMAPSGSGLYVVPTLDSIKVGYQFASDLITIGNIEFMNIAIDVFADLPFGPTAARFGFNFASEERPFIIACAPYGGGGYVKLEMEAGGSKKNLAVSFFFGAAVAFDFGILAGYGRVSAGFALIDTKGGLTIQAIVEAVGEGHIACFSLSIFIRIVLVHSPHGDLDGSATYRFSFKVGFFKVHYSMTAHRHISGSGDGDAQQQRRRAQGTPAPVDVIASDPVFTINTDAPVKSRAWKKYRRHIALDLIDDN
ncbi:hypothetical protein [Dokdonella soli]|uniref:hypothetical protein n=1 Tax=Dokdonella soli TaxID=529810 RepID=UPI0031D625C7